VGSEELAERLQIVMSGRSIPELRGNQTVGQAADCSRAVSNRKEAK